PQVPAVYLRAAPVGGLASAASLSVAVAVFAAALLAAAVGAAIVAAGFVAAPVTVSVAVVVAAFGTASVAITVAVSVVPSVAVAGRVRAMVLRHVDVVVPALLHEIDGLSAGLVPVTVFRPV